ncbi:Zinc finger RING-type [Arabidopsis thaliana x Arabidopsis arenosa]|uniref:RING-type E3 ubiquitin transferase n=1 Tax=Arabidopsis thaliana x Arabidopsis arenosa TaxID=1240361 RepID=A0A8T1Y902_9BRAS|nr:Zinc finger RING-type [Arabidopsis thaliana x Arabidopsis arenosa]KAG7541403.1 Zinc finger RING-type [Arabidopsis thaliana x Arabidopsis arenosa]
MAARYWCHMCSQMVNPIIDAEIKCPFCQSGFVEEMSREINGGSSSSLREVQDPGIDFGTDRALSLWGPILLGMMSNPRRRRRFRRTEFGVDNDEVNGVADVDGNDSNVDNDRHHHRRHRHRQQSREIDLDREFESILRRRRRSSASILQLLQGIRAGIASEYESSDRDQFNQSAVVQGSTSLNQNRNNTSLSAIGDYFVGPSLDHLLEHLADNDSTRHGSLPARKEAVENLPTVKICESLQCSICLDDFDRGSEAKEMPCKHKFHIRCIVPWLELHSSCPVCRYELPPDDETKVDPVRPRTRTLEINISNENVEDDARNSNVSERRFSFPWPFSGLFSSSSSSSASASGSSHLGENS